MVGGGGRSWATAKGWRFLNSYFCCKQELAIAAASCAVKIKYGKWLARSRSAHMVQDSVTNYCYFQLRLIFYGKMSPRSSPTAEIEPT